jgi:hypothetical protein
MALSGSSLISIGATMDLMCLSVAIIVCYFMEKPETS